MDSTPAPKTKSKGQPKGLLGQFQGRKSAMPTVSASPSQMPTGTFVAETSTSLLSKVWPGTQKQIQILTSLNYPDGNPVIDIKRKDIILEIVGMLNERSFEDVTAFLEQATSPEYILWEQESVESGRTRLEREIAVYQVQDTGTKGVGRCRFCTSTELVYATKQLRSGDEPATVFVRCVLCGKNWRE